MKSAATNRPLAFLGFIILSTFFLCVNFLMPHYSDDFPNMLATQGLSGLQAAQHYYSVAGGSEVGILFHFFQFLHHPKWIFNVVNSALCIAFVFCYYRLIFGELPKADNRSVSLCACLLSSILLFTQFGECFTWMVGASYNAFGMLLCTLFLIPYRDLYTQHCSSSQPQAIIRPYLVWFLPISFLAGLAALTATLLLLALQIVLISFFLWKRKALPVWVFSGLFLFSLGIICCLHAPGFAARTSHSIQSNQGYMSISAYWHLSFFEKIKRLSIVYAVAIGKNMLLSLSLLVTAIYTFRYTSGTLRTLLTILILSYFASYLPWISYLSIPDRGLLFSHLIAIAAILLCLANHITLRAPSSRLLTPMMLFCLGYMSFVVNEYYLYHHSWTHFTQSIQSEKQQGKTHITDLSPIYCSRYPNAVGYPGMPRKDSRFYVNASIAHFYNVNSVAIRASAPDTHCENALRYYFRKQFYLVTQLQKPKYIK